jgi:predicted transcriptional regulator
MTFFDILRMWKKIPQNKGGEEMTDLKLLREVIDESGLKITALSEKAGINRTTLYNRLNGKGDFTVSEMSRLSDALRLSSSDRDRIFFA